MARNSVHEVTETAASVEKAVEAGAKKLGIHPEDAGYEVIEEGRAGLLGFGAKKAKVRVFLRGVSADAEKATAAAEPASPRRGARAAAGAAKREPRGDALRDARPVRGGGRGRGRGGRSGPGRGRERAPEESSESAQDLVARARPDDRDRAPRSRDDRESRRDRQRDDRIPAEKISADDPALREAIEFVGRCLDDSFRVVSFREEDEHLIAEITAKNLALVLGRRGITLDAIETVTRATLSAKGMGRVRLVLDTEGFRARRQQVLEEMAREAAAEVESSGEAIRLDPMSNRDRRIVHETLKDHAGIRTESEGRGDDRYVVLFPGTGEPRRERGGRDRDQDRDRGGRDRADRGRGRGGRDRGGRDRDRGPRRDRAEEEIPQRETSDDLPEDRPDREERPRHEERPPRESPRPEPPRREERHPVSSAPVAASAAPATPVRRLTMGTKRIRRKR